MVDEKVASKVADTAITETKIGAEIATLPNASESEQVKKVEDASELQRTDTTSLIDQVLSVSLQNNGQKEVENSGENKADQEKIDEEKYHQEVHGDGTVDTKEKIINETDVK